MLWGWAMLLVVLLSATPTGSAPRTRLLGSAFDPASVSVVLSPRQLRLPASTSPLSKPKPDDTATEPVQVAIVTGLPALVKVLLLPQPLPAGEQPIISPLSSTRANGQRAPPPA